MKKPTVAECLEEIRRLRAKNERLTRQIEVQLPTSRQLMPIAVELRDLAFWFERKAREIDELKTIVYRLVGEDYLPSATELGGIWGKGAERVRAAELELPIDDATKAHGERLSDPKRRAHGER